MVKERLITCTVKEKKSLFAQCHLRFITRRSLQIVTYASSLTLLDIYQQRLTLAELQIISLELAGIPLSHGFVMVFNVKLSPTTQLYHTTFNSIRIIVAN